MGFIQSDNFNPLDWYRRVHKAAPKVTKVTSEKARIRKLLAKSSASIQRAFSLFVSASTDATALRQVRQLLEAGNIDGALKLVDKHIARLAESLARVFTDVAVAEAANWRTTLDAVISFRVGDERAATLMQSNRLEFITDFTARQRTVTRNALVQGMRQGLGAASLAGLFRDTIGLTPGYQQWVDNYRGSLIAGSSDALSRDLRDRRFDRTVTTAIDDDVPLTPQQIDRMVSTYSQRMVAWRAENIARTEGLKVTGQAQREMMLQTLEQAGISRNLVVKDWVTNLDGRERQSHGDANGQRRLLDVPFDVGSSQLQFPGDTSLGAPIAERASCRCVPTYRIAKDADEVARLLGEK